jgi:hypothetical protein
MSPSKNQATARGATHLTTKAEVCLSDESVGKTAAVERHEAVSSSTEQSKAFNKPNTDDLDQTESTENQHFIMDDDNPTLSGPLDSALPHGACVETCEVLVTPRPVTNGNSQTSQHDAQMQAPDTLSTHAELREDELSMDLDPAPDRVAEEETPNRALRRTSFKNLSPHGSDMEDELSGSGEPILKRPKIIVKTSPPGPRKSRSKWDNVETMLTHWNSPLGKTKKLRVRGLPWLQSKHMISNNVVHRIFSSVPKHGTR